MNPDENTPEMETGADEPAEVQSSEVYSAELADESTSESESEVVDAASVSQDDSVSSVFEQAASDAVLVGAAGEGLWGSQQSYQVNRPPSLPAVRETQIARLCFGVAATCSFLFLLWFCIHETRTQQNPLVVVRYVTPVTFVFLASLAGLIRVANRFVPSDARWLGWIGAAISCVCFLFFFPARWRAVCFLWAAVQFGPIIANAFAPHRPADEEHFDVHDSIAANGGSIASVVLGVWAIVGSLFTSISMVNSGMGVVLGIWGLSSRKKGLAVLGIVLCTVGALACLMNVAYLFWEVLSAQEEELMQPGL